MEKIVEKKSEKSVWIWVELKNSEKEIVEKKVKKRSGYGLNWKIVEKKVKKGSGYGSNWKIVEKNKWKKKSGKKKVKKGSGYGLKWKIIEKKSGKSEKSEKSGWLRALTHDL